MRPQTFTHVPSTRKPLSLKLRLQAGADEPRPNVCEVQKNHPNPAQPCANSSKSCIKRARTLRSEFRLRRRKGLVQNSDRRRASIVVMKGMAGYGQFCAVARAHEVLGGRWTLLVARELLSGARRFSEIRRGIPRISRTMLFERLQALVDLGVILREEGAYGPEYAVTDAGAELADHIRALAGC